MSPGKPSYIGRFGGLTVPGTPVGAIVSIGLVVLCWLAIPLARPFICWHRRAGAARGVGSVVEA